MLLTYSGGDIIKRRDGVAMPRQARAKSSTKIYHCVLRGVDKRDIFMDDQDRYKFIDELKETKEKCKFDLYAFCLMNNHVHLLIYDKEDKLSKIMHSIALNYSIYFNLKYERTGHLFQNRYFSSQVETNEYLMKVQKYIHQNPPFMQTYKWSSYREYIEEQNRFVDINQILSLFDANRQLAIYKFKEFTCKRNKKISISEYKNIEFVREVSDEKFIQIISDNLGIKNILKINIYNTRIRNEYLKRILDIEGASISQVSRIMGIDKKTLSTLKHEETCPKCWKKPTLGNVPNSN